MNWKQILALAASIGTVASPIDLIPDFLGPLGLADDAVAIVVAGVTLYKAVKAFRAARAVKNTADAAKNAGRAGSAGGAAGAAGGAAGPTGQGARIIADPGDLPKARRK